MDLMIVFMFHYTWASYRNDGILLVSYVLKRVEIDVVGKIVRPVPKAVEEVGGVSSSISITCDL
jgi:hypothetical protein